MDESNIAFGDIEFVHFDTNNDCEKFLNFASQKNITISHKCCDGNGCGVKNIKKEQLDIIITPFLISNAHFIGQKIRKNVKSIVGISPTMVLLFPVLLL